MSDEALTGDMLDDFLNAEPVAECSACGRKTWEPGNIGQTCYMPQPDGKPPCAGKFRRL